MKKIYLLALLCLPFIQLQAQNGVLFKIKYLPNHDYKMTINLGMKINATLSGDSSLLDKLKTEGITQPVMVDIQFGADGDIKTGTAASDKTIPLNMDFKIDNIAVTANGKQAPIPQTIAGKDIKIVAHIGADGLSPAIDSVMGKKTNDSTQKNMQQMMSLVQKQIKFPDKPLKPGDTFTQGMPLNIPITKGNNMKMDAGVTYKLVSISDGKAYFDLVPNFNMDFTMQKVAVSVTGTGTGKMIYSIKDNFPLSREISFDMKIKVTSEKMNVDGTAAITTSSATVIN